MIPALIVRENGNDLTNTKTLTGIGQRKLITQSMVLSLFDVIDKDSSSGDK